MKRCPKCGKSYPNNAKYCVMDASELNTEASQHSSAEGSGADALIAGRYRVAERIGGHRTGSVFAGVDITSAGAGSGEVAIKRVAAAVLASPIIAERTLRELRDWQGMQVPGVVKVVDHQRLDSGELTVVMERVAGFASLESYVKARGRLALVHAVTTVTAAGEALSSAHKAGVIHRDASAKNLLVREGGVAGPLAKPPSCLWLNLSFATPGAGTASGVPAFMSPEQNEGKSPDQRSNVYSMAALCYYALTGKPPFDAADHAAVLVLQNAGPPRPVTELVPGVPSELSTVLLKALDRQPVRRPATVQQLLSELAAVELPSGGHAAAAPNKAMQTLLGMPAPVIPLAAASPAPAPSAAAVTSGVVSVVGAEVAGGAAAAVGPAAAGVAPAAPAALAAVGVAPAAAPSGPNVTMIAGGARRTPPPAVLAAAAPVGAASAAPAPIAPSAVATTATSGNTNGQGVPATSTAASVLAAVAASSQAAGTATGAGAKAAQPAGAGKGASAGKGDGKKGPALLRETLWFHQGEVEAELARKLALGSSAELPVPKEGGALSAEDQKRLSLRTGHTEVTTSLGSGAQQAADAMSASELLQAINRQHRFRVVLVVGGIALGVAALVAYIASRPTVPAEAPPAAASPPS